MVVLNTIPPPPHPPNLGSVCPSVGPFDGVVPSQSILGFPERVVHSQGVDAFAGDAAQAANEDANDEEDEEDERDDDDGDLRGRQIEVDQRSGSGQRLHVNVNVTGLDATWRGI